MAAYYAKNKERLKQQNRARAEKNKERIIQRRKSYYLENKARIDAHNAAYRAAHPEKNRQRERAYYLKTKDNKRREYRKRAIVLDRINRATLGDRYLKALIAADLGISRRRIPASLVAIKRIEVQIKRKYRTLCQNQKT